jgi:hypothetical protein
MVEGKWPKEGGERGVFQECAHSVSDGLVGALRAAVVMRGVGAGQLHIIPIACEDVVHGAAFAEFTALVETDELVRAVRAERGQPAVKVLQRWCLGLECFAREIAAEVIRDDDIAGFVVEPEVRVVSAGVLRSLDDEAEVDRHALVALCGLTGRIRASRVLAHFGCHAGGAL